MAGFGHGAENTREVIDDAVVKRNTRVGLVLFFIYLLIYGVFVGLNAFWPDSMKIQVMQVNLSVVYGLGLILMAFLLSAIYTFICAAGVAPTKPSDSAANQGGAQ